MTCSPRSKPSQHVAVSVASVLRLLCPAALRGCAFGVLLLEWFAFFFKGACFHQVQLKFTECGDGSRSVEQSSGQPTRPRLRSLVLLKGAVPGIRTR